MDLSDWHAVGRAVVALSPSLLIWLCSSCPSLFVPSPTSSLLFSLSFCKCLGLLMRTTAFFVGLVKRWPRKRTPDKELTDGASQAIHKALGIQANRANAKWEILSSRARLDPFKEAIEVNAGAAGLGEHYMTSARPVHEHV